METPETDVNATKRPVWNAGRSVGAKRALKPKQIWEIRFFLNERRRLRDRALFDLAIDSKLRGCDLVRMKIGDIGGKVCHAPCMGSGGSAQLELKCTDPACDAGRGGKLKLAFVGAHCPLRLHERRLVRGVFVVNVHWRVPFPGPEPCWPVVAVPQSTIAATNPRRSWVDRKA